MTIFNLILDNINAVLCVIVGIAFSFQLVYTLLFFLPAPKFPKAKKKHYVGVIIPAHNESVVIERTLKFLDKMNYPKNKYEVIVIADNCTDNTAELVRNFKTDMKVRVIERQESDKSKRNVGWAFKYAFEKLMPEIDNFEFFVRFDADDIPQKNYLDKMNDAFENGADAAKGYNHASNLTQNVIADVSGLWYIRDTRFSCQARAALHTDVFLVGGGMMFSAKIIKENGGWTCTQYSDDTQFTIQCMDNKHKVKYVPDAVVYEDQPSTLKDIFRRNIRMGNNLHTLFWTKGFHCLGKFFTTFRYCYLDMFLNLFFIPIAVLCCLWFPTYYIYKVIFDACVGNIADLNQILIMIGIILVCAFLIPFIAQAFLVYALDRKKIGVPFKKLVPSMLAFPMFMIIYAISIVIGVFSKPKWKQITRNVEFLKKTDNQAVTEKPTDFTIDENQLFEKEFEDPNRKHRIKFASKRKIKVSRSLKGQTVVGLANYPITMRMQDLSN